MVERRRDNITQLRTRIYRQGFHKAISYLYKKANAGEKFVFEPFLKKYLGSSGFIEFTAPIDDSGCPRGQCSDGAGGCVECIQEEFIILNEQTEVEGEEKTE